MSDNNRLNMSESDSYKKIFKATTLFGGVQAYQIIIQIIRSKFVAVLLGTTGMGIQGLYFSTLNLINSITSLGLSQSAVRDVSEANGSGDTEKIVKTASVLRRLVWITGLLGMITLILFSPLLSKTTFGNTSYTLPLILLSVTLLMDQLATGQRVLLQGMRRLKDLAKVSAIGTTIGLALSVPIYYAWGINGILPALILNSLSGLLIAWYFSKRISLPQQTVSFRETISGGKRMVRMGILMSLSGTFSSGISYVIRSFIMNHGGVEEVGLFQAGFTIINTYVGMIFTAIGTDFYPRLAAVNSDNEKCRVVVSQQGEIATQILAPLLCLCVLLMPFILRILYSDQFADAVPFVLWCCPGMMFKLSSWIIAFQFVAKAESKVFLTTEILSNSTYLLFSLIGYKYGGLLGLGIAFSANYLVYMFIVYFISAYRYKFAFSSDFLKSFIFQFFLIAISLLIIFFFKSAAKFWLCTAIVVASCVYALIILDKKMMIVSQIRNRIRLHNNH